MDKTLIDETHRSLDEELSDLLPEVGESVVEDGEAPGLPEVGIEVLDETLVKARHQVVEETLVKVVEAQQVADINQLWSRAQYQNIMVHVFKVNFTAVNSTWVKTIEIDENWAKVGSKTIENKEKRNCVCVQLRKLFNLHEDLFAWAVKLCN